MEPVIKAMKGTATGIVVLVLLAFPAFAQNSPHVAWGNIVTSNRIPPAENALTVVGYISTRPNEILTNESFGCGYYGADGTWWLNTGNFATEWQIGDTLVVIFISRSEKHIIEFQKTSGQLTGAGNDYFGTAVLQPGARIKSLRRRFGLILFRANRVSSRKIKLSWQLAEGTRLVGFFIERAAAGSQDFKPIAFVHALGEKGSQAASYFDRPPESAEYQYRLRLIDEKGQAELSEVDLVGGLPMFFSLAQNYPNPFRVSNDVQTKIPFSLFLSGDVQVTIYDVLGRVVSRYEQKTLPAGDHILLWDGRDQSGALLPSGTYFYTLQFGSHRLQKTLSLIR